MRKKILGLMCLLLFSLSCAAQESDYQAEIKAYRLDKNAEFLDVQRSPLSAEQMKNFKGHDFYPVDESYRVEARFEATPKSRPFPLKTSKNGTQLYQRLGILHFELDGEKQTLEAYLMVRRFLPPGQKEIVFLPVIDATTGKATYGAGRYLHYEGVPECDTWIIDFNKLYNPFCAYNEDYECPVVPEPNHLKVAVEAGVKDYNGG